MKKNLIICFIILILAGCGSGNQKIKIKMNKKTFTFDVAATEKARQKGLMYIKKLDENSGMLFVYGEKEYLYYYMKNTYVPLDIAFIDEKYKIVDIQSMEPLDETTVKSKEEAMYALEVNRGFFNRIGIKVGDRIEFVTPVPYRIE